MFLHEMKHYCSEDIIELNEAERIDNGKNAHLLKHESIRILSVGKNIMLASINNDEKTVSVIPVNKHTEKKIESIVNIGMPKLAEVIVHEKKSLQVMVKKFADVKILDYSINVSDEFLNDMKYQIQMGNVFKPIQELEAATLLSSGIYSYAVIGLHTRAEENKKFDDFVIAGNNFYIHVKKKVNDMDKEFYCANRITKTIKKSEYKFFLAKGHLKYTDEKEAVREEVKQALGSMTDDSYIQVWNQYGDLERKMIMDKARELGAIRYTSFESEGNRCRFDVASVSDFNLKKFKEEFSKDDMLAITLINPFEIQRENDEFSQFIKRNHDFIVNAKLAADINVGQGSVYFILDDDGFNKIAKLQSGYIFMSTQGDEQRLRRREIAREKIETLTCPMPNLAAVLEGRSVASPRKKHIPALSELVEKEIFTNKEGNYRAPTEKQASAIEMALNTPDIALIQGPPGTGKTTVITAILKRLNEEADSTGGMFGRNLVTAFQHDAVQNAIDRIEILGLPAIKFGKKYSDIENEFLDVNTSVQKWINEKLVDLNIRHSDILGKKYLTDYNKIFINYMYSAKSVDQTITILELVRTLLDDKLSVELMDKLNQQIRDLMYLTKGKTDSSLISLNRAIRRIPISEVAFSDDGKGTVHFAIMMLKRQDNDAFAFAINEMVQMEQNKQYKFDVLKKIRKTLLVQIIPKEKVFTEHAKKDEITALLTTISGFLLKQIEGGKDGEDLILLQYMQSLEENPLAIKNAILDYTSVNGATNQQVMRTEIRNLKGGKVIYDNVLVDEAARSNPLDLFIPLSVARDRIILVGDHRQLPHMIDENIVNELEKGIAGDLTEVVNQKIKESMFEQLFTKLKMLEKADGIKRTITLDKQFRMHPSLGKFVNDNFYEKYKQSERVENGIESPDDFSHNLPGIQNKACIWYEVPFDAGKEINDKSKSRRIEAVKIAQHLKKMLESEKGKNYTYGIITFYREQVNVIYEELANTKVFVKDESNHYVLSSDYWNGALGDRDYIKIGTVDAFQGMEFDFVYLSIVRSNDNVIPCNGKEKEIAKLMQNKYGFLMYENRLCVAMSRQKKALICVGDSGMLSGNMADLAVPSLIEYHRLCKEDEYGEEL